MSDSPPKSGITGDRPARTIDFERGIPFLVAALGNRLSAIASRSVRRDLGVGLMEWRTLALLAVETEATPARIGRVAGVDKSVVSRAVGSLEQRGLVEITSDPAASRQTRLSLTPKGLELHERGIGMAYTRNGELLQGFSPEEREQLADLLKRATANLPVMEGKPAR
ncbi:MAG TPA: MarR family transcriptional regulator [Caulobacteraceae bacterium]